MYKQHAESIRDSYHKAVSIKPVSELSEFLFDYLFTRFPEARDFFAGRDLAIAGPKKYRVLVDTLLDVLEYPDFAESRLDEEVYRHMVYQLRDREYYFVLIDGLIESIRVTLGEEWSDQYQEHWQEAAGGMRHMIDLAAKHYLV